MLDPSLPLTVQEYEEWGEPGYEIFVSVIKMYLSVENASKIILKFLGDLSDFLASPETG